MQLGMEQLIPRTLTTRIATALGIATFAGIMIPVEAPPHTPDRDVRVYATSVGDAHLLTLNEQANGFRMANCEALLPRLVEVDPCENTEQTELPELPEQPVAPVPEVVEEAAPPPTTTTTTSTTAPPPPPPPPVEEQAAPAPAPEPEPRTGEPADAEFDRLAQCESGGNWAINTGNGYYGGLQFAARTWKGLGGTGLPHEHPRETQIDIARKQWRQSGWRAWPSCSRKLGYR